MLEKENLSKESIKDFKMGQDLFNENEEPEPISLDTVTVSEDSQQLDFVDPENFLFIDSVKNKREQKREEKQQKEISKLPKLCDNIKIEFKDHEA